MADQVHLGDDISALWGPGDWGDRSLAPVATTRLRPLAPTAPSNGAGNGHRPDDGAGTLRAELLRLADAVEASRVTAVGPDQLEELRAQLVAQVDGHMRVIEGRLQDQLSQLAARVDAVVVARAPGPDPLCPEPAQVMPATEARLTQRLDDLAAQLAVAVARADAADRRADVLTFSMRSSGEELRAKIEASFEAMAAQVQRAAGDNSPGSDSSSESGPSPERLLAVPSEEANGRGEGERARRWSRQHATS